ncbi:MAG: Spy/CpxP family protein refolding chaperone [Candidatus Cryptobacteroides sp.]
MKRMLLPILLCLSSLTAICQEKADDVNNKFFDAKIREFVYRLELTDSQRDAFIPIYKRYSDEMREIVGDKKRYQDPAETSEEAATRAKERIERQQKAQSVRLKYVDEFATVLNPSQLGRLFEVENQIQRKLMNYKKGGQKPDGRQGKPGRSGQSGKPGAPKGRMPMMR